MIILLLELLDVLLECLVDLSFLRGMIPVPLHRRIFEQLTAFVNDDLVVFFLVQIEGVVESARAVYVVGISV